MQPFTPAQAEEALTHLTQHFAQWRQSRRTPRGRIPAGLWARAVVLTATFSVSRVAKQLGLTPHALQEARRGDQIKTCEACGRILILTEAPVT